MKAASSKFAKAARAPRARARLACVQALYQMDMAGTDLNAVIEEFSTHRFAPDAEDKTVTGADANHFCTVLKGVVERQRELDPLIDQQLATGWRLVRIDSILRAILRAGVLELMACADIPGKVVITEYVDVAHAFFDGDEPKVVNGVLDKLARHLRPQEFSLGPAGEPGKA